MLFYFFFLIFSCNDSFKSVQFGVHVAAWTSALELHWFIMHRMFLVGDGPANGASHRYHLFDFFR